MGRQDNFARILSAVIINNKSNVFNVSPEHLVTGAKDIFLEMEKQFRELGEKEAEEERKRMQNTPPIRSHYDIPMDRLTEC